MNCPSCNQEIDSPVDTFCRHCGSRLKSPRKSSWCLPSVLHLTIYVVGVPVYCALEGWTFFEAIYFCFVGMATIGTGDLSPKTEPGRGFFIVHAIFGLPIFLWTLNAAAESILRKAAIGRKKLGFSKLAGHGSCLRVRNFFLDPDDQVGLTFTCFVLAWSLGSAIVMAVEPITPLDSLYFMFAVLTTVGFGDIVCTSTVCRLTVLSMGYISIGLLSAFITAAAVGFRRPHLTLTIEHEENSLNTPLALA